MKSYKWDLINFHGVVDLNDIVKEYLSENYIIDGYKFLRGRRYIPRAYYEFIKKTEEQRLAFRNLKLND